MSDKMLDAAYFRAHTLKAGHTLTEQDAADIQEVLAEYNDMIVKEVNLFQEAREGVLREIGGDVLVQAAAKADEAMGKYHVKRAFQVFRAKEAEYNKRTAQLDAVPEDVTVLSAALLWLRNHYNVACTEGNSGYNKKTQSELVNRRLDLLQEKYPASVKGLRMLRERFKV